MGHSVCDVIRRLSMRAVDERRLPFVERADETRLSREARISPQVRILRWCTIPLLDALSSLLKPRVARQGGRLV